MKARILTGDMRETLKLLPDNSVDAIVTDPPYGLSFMGKGWDHQVPGVDYWKECLRVAKPGAHIVAFSGTRTGHRLACALEDAGWELRDCLMWLYGSGFPKSHDISKAIDKEAGEERQVMGEGKYAKRGRRTDNNSYGEGTPSDGEVVTAPATPAAQQWQGWGTALKPAWEPIYLARKPFDGTVASNVLEHGTGAINVDACRIAGEGQMRWEQPRGGIWSTDSEAQAKLVPTTEGRWPANLCLDESAAAMLDEQTGTLTSGKPGTSKRAAKGMVFNGGGNDAPLSGFGDSGGASRFFYVAKASRSEREAGLQLHRSLLVKWTWANVDHEATLLVDTAASPPRVTAVSGVQCLDASAWSTLLFGNEATAPYLKGCRFTTSTETSSTTHYRTLNWLARSYTNVSTADATSETASSTSPAASVGKATLSIDTTSGMTVSLPGVGPAASGTLLTISESEPSARMSSHPTVKPIALMQWLIKLITPPGGIVLDPFNGSGSTGCAAVSLGHRYIGCELNPEYVDISMARMRHWAK